MQNVKQCWNKVLSFMATILHKYHRLKNCICGFSYCCNRTFDAKCAVLQTVSSYQHNCDTISLCCMWCPDLKYMVCSYNTWCKFKHLWTDSVYQMWSGMLWCDLLINCHVQESSRSHWQQSRLVTLTQYLFKLNVKPNNQKESLNST